jgi:diguanylate cyclase (GGDEF)-like protein
MADVDNLKPINDNYGHRAGDMAIKQISRRISACIRQIDAAARYGGDEFAVILPNTSLADAVVVAQRMVDMVSSTPMVWEKSEIPLSISVGVGQYNSDIRADDVTKATDQALYAAKQAGKNTVKVFEPEPVWPETAKSEEQL